MLLDLTSASRQHAVVRVGLLVASLGASVAAGCADSDRVPPGTGAAVDEDALRRELDAWRGRILKDCNLADAMPSAYAGASLPDIERVLDATLVRKRLGEGLWIDAADGERYILDQPSSPSFTSFGSRTFSATRNGEVTQDLTLASELSLDGTCVIRWGNDEVYRGQLWGGLPVAIHVPPRFMLGTSREGWRGAFVSTGAQGMAYVTDPSLAVLVDDLALSASEKPAADSAIARALEVDVAGVRDLVTTGNPWFDHVVIDGASAPAPVIARGFGPLDSPTTAVFPIAIPGLRAWFDAGSHTADILLPRTALGAGAATSLRITLIAEAPTGTVGVNVRTTIREIGVPTFVPPAPGASAACVRAVADAVLAYQRDPATNGSGSDRYPSSIVRTPAGIYARWVTAPCARFTPDLAADLRSDLGSLRRFAALLDPAPFGVASIHPDRWGALLAAVIVDQRALDDFAAVAVAGTVTAAVRTQAALLGDAAYRAAGADEQLARRALFWHTALLCGHEPSAALRAAMMGVAPADIAGTIRDLTTCPVL